MQDLLLLTPAASLLAPGPPASLTSQSHHTLTLLVSQSGCDSATMDAQGRWIPNHSLATAAGLKNNGAEIYIISVGPKTCQGFPSAENIEI